MKTAGIQAIVQKINVDAEQHGSEHRDQMKNEIDAEINSETALYLSDLAKRREMLQKHNELEYARLFERIGSRLNREILTYQHNLIDEIFDMAASKLRESSKEEFTDLFKAAVKDLKGDFILYLGEFSIDKLDKTEIERQIKKENNGKNHINIILSDEFIPKKSGFVLRDERVEYNCLFEDLIEDKKNRQSASILQEVFGDYDNKLT